MKPFRTAVRKGRYQEALELLYGESSRNFYSSSDNTKLSGEHDVAALKYGLWDSKAQAIAIDIGYGRTLNCLSA